MTPTARQLPLSPKTCTELQVGDLIPVHLSSGEWGCLQVTDLKRTGPGSLKSLVVGVLPWRGARRPTAADVEGLAVVVQALTGIEIFTEGGLEVTGQSEDLAPSGPSSNFRDLGVGAKHHVWGWKTAVRAAETHWRPS